MLNIAFSGNLFNGTEVQFIGNEVRYTALYYPINSHPSTLKWDSASRLSEFGQYNINLGDSTFLGQDGNVANGDKVFILFWTPTTEEKNSSILSEWSLIEIELTGLSTYIIDAQLKPAQTPTCHFTYTKSGRSVIVTDASSAETSWTFHSYVMQQLGTIGSEAAFFLSDDLHGLVDISWGDTQENIDEPAGEAYTHIYTHAGAYTITCRYTGANGLYCQTILNIITVYVVNNGLTWTTPVFLDISKTFEPQITGDTLHINYVNYYHNNVLIKENLGWDEFFSWAFAVGGTHKIKQVITFNNGTSIVDQEQDFNVIINPIARFISEDYECGLKFTSTSIAGLEPFTSQRWEVSIGNNLLAIHDSPEFYYNWPVVGTYRITLDVTDSSGAHSSIFKDYFITECKGNAPEADHSTGGGYASVIYKDAKFPKINIEKIEDDDIKISIKIKKVVDLSSLL